jgi:hypothetical protein
MIPIESVEREVILRLLCIKINDCFSSLVCAFDDTKAGKDSRSHANTYLLFWLFTTDEAAIGTSQVNHMSAGHVKTQKMGEAFRSEQ